MTRARNSAFAALACLAALAPVTATAVDELTVARGWTRVDEAESANCRAVLIGNGQFYRVSAFGLRGEEPVSFSVLNSAVDDVNGRIRPLEYRLKARGDGTLRQFYIPFIPNKQGGSVTISLASASCDLSLAFDWQRRQP